MEDIKVSGSIVLYKEKPDILIKCINSFISLNFKKELIIIDNSPTNSLKKICLQFENVKYFHNKRNIGFGKAHNMAFKKLEKKSDIHLILNPDIYFNSEMMEDFIRWLFYSSDIVLAIPKVLYPNGKIQNISRKIPTVSSLIKRQFVKNTDELVIKNNVVEEIPFAHGCFFAFKSKIFEKLNGFDTQFFMYMEDIDIWIRAKNYGKTVINSNYEIYHYFRKASKKNLKLFIYHFISAIKFFIKYKRKIV